MPEMPDLKRKYGFQLTPEQMIYMEQTRPKTGGQTVSDIISQSSPELVPEQNILQRMSSGAGKAADLVNKYVPKIYDKIPKKITSLAPFGFVGLNPGFQDLLSQSRKDVSNTEVPTSLKIIPSIDTTTGEMQPAGFGKGRASIGKIASSIKPADLLGLTSAQKVYSDLGYGQAPEPLDVLDTFGLSVGMTQLGRAGFKGASSVAKASAPYVAEGLTDLVSKYGVDPRMNITPDAPSMSGAVPEGFKLGQENGKYVLFDSTGKIFAQGNDAKSAIFRANKRLENEAANAARAASRVEVEDIKVPADELGFYSATEKAAANLKRNLGTGEVFLSDIRKFPDVTTDELKMSGLEDWLKGKESVTRQEVQEYIQQNKPKLEEVKYEQGEGNADDLKFDDGEILDDYDYIDSRAEDLHHYLSDDKYIRNEIEQDIIESYEPEDLDQMRADGRFDEMVNDKLWERAQDQASEEYYENPYRQWTNDVGYTITGNDDVGYSIQNPRGGDITPSRGTYDFETANGIVMDDAIERGYIDEGNTKFHDYQLPGGENYREILIKAGEPRGKYERNRRFEAIADEMYEIGRRSNDAPPDQLYAADQQRYAELSDERSRLYDEDQAQKDSTYSSSHWDEPDVIAHVRLQDRVDADGNKVLYVDEMQSDWHQEGAEYGYKSKEHNNIVSDLQKKREDLRIEFVTLNDHYSNVFEKYLDENRSSTALQSQREAFERSMPEMAEIKNRISELKNEFSIIDDQISDLSNAVPEGPYKDDWHELALKKVMNYAAKNGYDRVAFSSSRPQVQRWGTESFAFEKSPMGGDTPTWRVSATEQRGGRAGHIDIEADARARGVLQESQQNIVESRDQLRSIVQKTGRNWTKKKVDRVTDKLWKKMQEEEIGIVEPRREGMEEFYDRTLGNTINKYAKKYSGKVSDTFIPAVGDKQPAKVIEITQEMKKSLLTGQPMKEGGAVTMAEGGYVDDVLGMVDDHFASQLSGYNTGGAVHMKEGGVPETKQEFRAVEPEPIMGGIASGLNKASEFLKSRPMKETDDMSSAINTALELADSFFVNDLAKTAERISYGDRLTSGKGQTLKVLPETLGAVTTVLPVVTKLAKPVAKAVTKLAPEVGETAAQMAERYAIQPSYVVPPTKGKRMTREEAEAAGLWHPISDVKLVRPYDEMTSVTVDNPAVKMAPRKILTSDDLLGKTGIQLVGDRAATGKILNEINGVKLEWPVPLTGGGKYSMANLSKDPNKSAAWESGKGVVTKLQDQIDMAAKESDDVLGIFSTGSLQQVDFNSMMSSALAAQLKGAKISKNAAKEFDEEMVKFVPKFAGIKSSKLKDQIFDKSNGVLRTKFVELMEQERFQKMGFPSVPATRKAITDLEYLDVPLGTTGLVINKMDKGRRIVTPDNPSDYPLAMGGEYVGEIVGGLPYQTMFSTLNKQRRLLGANPAGDYRSYTQSKGFQKFDNEWQDTVEKYLAQRKKLTGKKKGGTVKKDSQITDDYSIAPEAKTGKWSQKDERAFQKGVRGTKWYKQFADKYGEPPDLNSKDYNYRAAWKAGVRPQDYEHDAEMQHWASTTGKGESLKATNHPTAWMEDYMQVTGSDPHEPTDMNPEQIKAMEKALMYRYGK